MTDFRGRKSKSMSFVSNLRVAFYSLMRTQGLALTVILTLALGIWPHDDGPQASGVAVLTYRFWATTLGKDPSVIGKTVRFGSGPMGDRSATVIGVLEPSVPYPQDTEIIANVVTSPHHLSATMVTDRLHRMTELFGRLAPGVTL